MDHTDPSKSAPNVFERLNQNIRNSISLRLFLIGIIALILLIPAGMVKELILEREMTKDQVVSRINRSWGDAQTIAGPVLTIPYYTHVENKDGKRTSFEHMAHFLPRSLKIDGQVNTQEKYISLFRSVVYTADCSIDAEFERPSFEEWDIPDEDIMWHEAYITVGMTDLRGIKERLLVDWNGETIELGPGTDNKDMFHTGVSAAVHIESNDSVTIHSFALDLMINGSERLRFNPLGEMTEVSIRGPWPHPNFEGAFPADSQEISEDGFIADWKILSLNRNFPQQWVDDSFSFAGTDFGLGLVTPVDDYQKSFRSVKYALMMIAFTFLIFFFLEVRSGKRVHPIQFILVGLALVVFYTLLVSLTEHIGFNTSYWVSAGAVSALIAIYFQAIFKEKGMTTIMVLILSIMYGFVFVTLQLMDYALLIGSIGLFIALSIVMILSRKVDWYALSDPKD